MASADILRAAHSPLPWSVQEDCKTSIWSGGHYGAEAYDGGEDTAAFINRACNAHYQMLKALKAAASALDEQGRRTGLRFPSTEEVIRAAIAAAEAEAGR